ncbi:GGDEF domain-containing protein [Shewanella colwelliana]|uniref:EAL domain-containing protein n=1 Tax=Shewanella colwelliana TaxID=23 RepID=UPI00299E26D7|nr:GGDEF domain-containing protein [Shewanella colwelliana]MDX1282411.1 GGDEF domain-containing protein [Shewanella colwelliana]
MSVSKTFHFLLVVIFISITLVLYRAEAERVTKLATEQFNSYTSSSVWLTSLPENGEALYSRLKQTYSFQFFQYIHSQDSSFNFTYGQLMSQRSDIIKRLFIQELGDTRALSMGRLQVKLSLEPILDSAASSLKSNLIYLWALYLLIAILFSLLMSRLKRSIRYASEAIASLASLKFDALAHSKFRGELKPVGLAIENSRTALHQQFNEINKHNELLNREAYQDPVTGFSTRPKFTDKLDNLAKPGKDRIGLLAMVKATELGAINQAQGRVAGDDYLAGVANCLRKALSEQSHVEFYRISSADFAVFIPDLVINDAEAILDKIKSEFDEYQQTIEAESVAYTGLVPYQQGNEVLSLVYLGDAAVSIAQTLGPNSYHIQEKLNGDELFGDSRWKEAVEDIIARKALRFHAQDIQPCRGEQKVYRELLSRFYSKEGKFLPTATVIAMAERHNLSVELDKIIILNTFRLLMDNPNLDGVFGINISTASVTQPTFVAWLKDLFIRQRSLASRIVLEVNESGMQANINMAYKFVRDMHSVGSRVSVEHFGMGFTSFKFFKEIRPDFIKLDGSYTDAIDSDDNNRFFVKMIVDVARKQSIKVVATSIERQEEKLAFEHLLVDGLQGYYIAKPKPISTKDEQSTVT